MEVDYKTIIDDAIYQLNEVNNQLASFSKLGIEAAGGSSGGISLTEMAAAVKNLATIPDGNGSFYSGDVDVYDYAADGGELV